MLAAKLFHFQPLNKWSLSCVTLPFSPTLCFAQPHQPTYTYPQVTVTPSSNTR